MLTGTAGRPAPAQATCVYPPSPAASSHPSPPCDLHHLALTRPSLSLAARTHCYALQVGQPHVFVSHGERDDVLHVDHCSRHLVPRLQADGYPTTYHEFRGGHAVPRSIALEALDWLDMTAAARSGGVGVAATGADVGVGKAGAGMRQDAGTAAEPSGPLARPASDQQ